MSLSTDSQDMADVRRIELRKTVRGGTYGRRDTQGGTHGTRTTKAITGLASRTGFSVMSWPVVTV